METSDQPICDIKTPNIKPVFIPEVMSDLKEGGGRGRGTKRKLEEKAPGGKKSKGELSTPPLPSNGYPKVLLLEVLGLALRIILSR